MTKTLPDTKNHITGNGARFEESHTSKIGIISSCLEKFLNHMIINCKAKNLALIPDMKTQRLIFGFETYTIRLLQF